jgi:hypothetical protein
MSSSWLLKTRQMKEPGKSILRRESLVTHLRSTRDRQLLREIIEEPLPLEDLLSIFAAFYLYNYSGIRLLSFDEAEELTIERKDELSREERRHLELEVRQLLGNKQREEIDLTRILSEFTIEIYKIIGDKNPDDSDVIEEGVTVLKKYLGRIPKDYSTNHDIDFINQATGWASIWRDELYVKASGLKETSLTLRDELLREHDEEVVETIVLNRGIKGILGRTEYLTAHLVDLDIPKENWNDLASTIIKHLCSDESGLGVIIKVHEIRLKLLEIVEEELESPITIEEYENRIGQVIAGLVGEAIVSEPSIAFPLISNLIGLTSDEVQNVLRSRGISDGAEIGTGLIAISSKKEMLSEEEESQLSKEELEDLERSLKRLKKLEHTLEKPVKGMLRSRGLRSLELDKVKIDFLTKKRSELIGIELQVLQELEKKVRVPTPDEMMLLFEMQDRVSGGALGSIGVTSVSEMTQQRKQSETMNAVKIDLVWYFTINLLNNLTRIVETYIRSKQDMLRAKALLRSIYENTESELQFLREEILIDLMANRIYEMKCVHPELDATTICTWMHARLSNMDMPTARDELASSPSPVFEGILDTPLQMNNLDYDNYAIAFDIMHRFLKQQRLQMLEKEELALELEREQQRIAESKKKSLDVLAWIYTKAHTVFRAIGRVGTKGLEWNANDDAKCANLLAYYVQMNRDRLVCSICGSSPAEGKCSNHGKGNMTTSKDMDNLAIFVMRSISDIKSGLIGPTADPMSYSEARSIVQREIGILKRRGKLTSKTNLKELLPGEINYIVGPAIARVIGRYFNESLEYAARRADLA